MPSDKQRNDPYIRSLVGKQLLSFIFSHPDMPWDWRGISVNHTITMEMIEAHPDKPWDWYWISDNPNLTIEFIEKNIHKPWNYYYGISDNPFNGIYDQIQERYSSRLMLMDSRKHFFASL